MTAVVNFMAAAMDSNDDPEPEFRNKTESIPAGHPIHVFYISVYIAFIIVTLINIFRFFNIYNTTYKYYKKYCTSSG